MSRMGKANKGNKNKYKGSSRLTYRDTNIVSFTLEEINKLVKEYKNTISECKIINENKIQLTSKLLKNIWFLENHENYIQIQHLNNGDLSVRTHAQFETYTLSEAFRSVSSHDIYKSDHLDYKKTDMGKLFELLKNGGTKFVKIS